MKSFPKSFRTSSFLALAVAAALAPTPPTHQPPQTPNNNHKTPTPHLQPPQTVTLK